MTLAYLYCVEMEQLGWRRWAPINVGALKPAGRQLGTVISDGEFNQAAMLHHERVRATEEKRLAREARREAVALAKKARIAEKEQNKAALSEKFKFNTPYYRAKREERQRRLEDEEKRIAAMTAEERADHEWLVLHQKVMNALRMRG